MAGAGGPEAAGEQWTSRATFVLATIGAAVGLGNIWRFAYVAGENGGGAFLLVYFALVLVIGLPLVIAEIALGRRGAGDAVAAFTAAPAGSLWRLAGWVGVAAAVLILSYYAVIAGWALKYLQAAVTGALWQTTEGAHQSFFDGFIAHGYEPVFWQALMLAAAAAVVAGGVRGGIERLNLWLMPLLALIVIGLALFAISLPGSGRGVAFLLVPDWSALTRPSVYLGALGQAFFSLGLGMAVFIAYGAYLGRSTAIPGAAGAVALGDTIFALIAGLAIFPAVFALGGDPAAGPALAFITLPKVFMAMPAGTWIGMLFFFLLSAAALTSMISLLEVGVGVASRRLGLARRPAVLVVTGTIFVLGLPSALGYGPLAGIRIAGSAILDAVDAAVSNLLLPLGGLLVALFTGWRLQRAEALAEADLDRSALGTVWLWLLRWVVPAAILLVLVRGIVGS